MGSRQVRVDTEGIFLKLLSPFQEHSCTADVTKQRHAKLEGYTNRQISPHPSITHLVSLFEHGHQIFGLFEVGRCEEGVRRAGGVRTARPTYPVDVVLGRVWIIVINYIFYSVHI